MAIKAKIKHWGSSLGIIIPKKVVEEKHLKAEEEVMVEIQKKSIKELFGVLKDWEIDAQSVKNELRKEWH